MRFFVGSDHAGVELRKQLVEALREGGHEIGREVGPDAPDDRVDYPDMAAEVCRRVLAEPGTFGLLVCGTGQGVAMAANRVPGIRAGCVADVFSARMIRAHNDANVLCLGARVLGAGLAAALLEAFCETSFEGGRHAARVAKLEGVHGSAAGGSTTSGPTSR
jgi:ribose 5-phosphate isomerase B